MIRAIIVAALGTIVLVGCAGSPAALEMGDTADLRLAETRDVINAWRFSGSQKMRDELERRRVFTLEEWADIDASRIRVGDRKLLVYAAWGKPSSVNRTVTDEGVYEEWTYGSRGRVYFSYSDTVTAIQQ